MQPKTTEPGPGGELKSLAKRRALISEIADLLLIEGVSQITLRDLARRLDTSDRMLLYYFEDKTDLVHAAITEVSSRLIDMLATSVSDVRRAPAEMLTITARLLASPRFTPFMNVWADIAARGGRGEEPFRAIARHSVERWLEWLDTRLAVADARTRRCTARALLVVIEGVRLVESAAPGAARGATTFLSTSFAPAVAPNR